MRADAKRAELLARLKRLKPKAWSRSARVVGAIAEGLSCTSPASTCQLRNPEIRATVDL